jgi:hypothetical protein
MKATMKKNLAQLFRWSLSLIGLIALVVVMTVALSLRPQGNSQGNGIQSLQERLVQLGIPVKSVTVTKPSPLEIEVILNSSGSNGMLSNDDMLNQFLTVREVELAYLNLATHIESYRLVLVTAKGDTLYDSTIFLHPDLPSQKLTHAPPSSVENSIAKNILERNLDFQGLRLLTLDLPSSYTASDNSKLVTLDLSTGKSADKTNNAQIGDFIMNLRSQMEDINNRFGTRVVLIHVRIKDLDDKLLVDYLEDFETGKQSSWVDENFVESWYPQPAPAISSEPQETTVPPILPTATPPKSTTLPTPTTRPVAYPTPPTSSPYP